MLAAELESRWSKLNDAGGRTLKFGWPLLCTTRRLLEGFPDEVLKKDPLERLEAVVEVAHFASAKTNYSRSKGQQLFEQPQELRAVVSRPPASAHSSAISSTRVVPSASPSGDAIRFNEAMRP